MPFVKPTALIRPVASLDPLFAFGDPLFAFVGKEKRLPLEVVLAPNSTPLADSDRILRALSLMVTPGSVDLTPTVVTLVEPADPGASPSRDLLFDVAAAQNDLSFVVAVPVAGKSELVAVAPLSFAAHFLSLEHEDEVRFPEVEEEGFAPDFKVVEIALRGEAAGVGAETWTLRVANPIALANNGYEVAEVVFESPATRIYNIVRQEVTVPGTVTMTAYSVQTFTVEVADGVETRVTIDGKDTETVTEPVVVEAGELSAETLAMFTDALGPQSATVLVGETAAVYNVESPPDAVTRTLRIIRTGAGTPNSRVSLKFAYTPPTDEGAAGEFARIIDLNTGVIEVFAVEVRPETLVIPRGGMADVTLVISNLALGDDPSEFISLSHSADVQISPQDGELDRINRRFEQVFAGQSSAKRGRASL